MQGTPAARHSLGAFKWSLGPVEILMLLTLLQPKQCNFIAADSFLQDKSFQSRQETALNAITPKEKQKTTTNKQKNNNKKRLSFVVPDDIFHRKQIKHAENEGY